MYYGKMHCSSLNLKILLSLVVEMKIFEVFMPQTENDPLMTFDLEKKNTLHTSCNINAYVKVMWLCYVYIFR